MEARAGVWPAAVTESAPDDVGTADAATDGSKTAEATATDPTAAHRAWQPVGGWASAGSADFSQQACSERSAAARRELHGTAMTIKANTNATHPAKVFDLWANLRFPSGTEVLRPHSSLL